MLGERPGAEGLRLLNKARHRFLGIGLNEYELEAALASLEDTKRAIIASSIRNRKGEEARVKEVVIESLTSLVAHLKRM